MEDVSDPPFRALCKENGADVVYHNLHQINSQRNRRKYFFPVKSRILKRPIFEDLLLNGNRIPNSSVVMKKSLLTQVGLISEDRSTVTWEDYDTWIQIATRTEDFKRIPKTLGYYWAGGDNLSSTEQDIENMKTIRKKYSQFYESRLSDTNPWWMRFNLGKSYLKLRNYERARINLLDGGRFPQLRFELQRWFLLLICFIKLGVYHPAKYND